MCGFFAGRALNTVDPRFASSGLGIDSKFNLRHIAPSEFDSDLDGLSDPFFHECSAQSFRHPSCRGLVIVILQPNDKVFTETVIKIHVVDHSDVTSRRFLEAYIRK
jgi:hypothetical protein